MRNFNYKKVPTVSLSIARLLLDWKIDNFMEQLRHDWKEFQDRWTFTYRSFFFFFFLSTIYNLSLVSYNRLLKHKKIQGKQIIKNITCFYILQGFSYLWTGKNLKSLHTRRQCLRLKMRKALSEKFHLF